MAITNQIQIRRGTASSWSTTNPTLAVGEPGFVTDLKRLKIGDGTTAWNSLGYVSPTIAVNEDISSTGSFIAAAGSAADPSFEFTGDPNTGLFSPAADTIGLTTNGVERLRIDSTGNVGIGTSSPGSPLTIAAGGGAGTIGGASQTQIFQVNDASAGDYVNLGHFNCESSLSRGSFMLSNNGTYGAWENNCLQFFTHGMDYPYGYYGGNLSDAGCAMIVTQGNDIQKLQIGNYNDAPIEFFINNTRRFQMRTDGNYNLYGDIFDSAANGPAFVFYNQADDVGELAAIAGGTDSNGYDQGKLRFFTGPANSISQRMCINSVGNVGIGTDGPAEKLHVVGNVNIDGNLTFDSFTESVVAIGNSSTSKTISLTSGTVQTCTLTGNCTFTMPTATAGKSFSLFLNTGSGGFTATFTGVRWSDSTSPTITSTASKVDLLSFISDGTYWYGSFSQNYG